MAVTSPPAPHRRSRPRPDDGDNLRLRLGSGDELARTGEYSVLGRAHPSEREARRERGAWAAAVVFGAATVLAALYSLERWFYRRHLGEPLSLAEIVPAELIFTYVWALLSPVVAWAARHFRIRGGPRLGNWASQVGVMLGVSLLHILLVTGVSLAVAGAATATPAVEATLVGNVLAWLVPDFGIYSTIIAVCYALVYYRVSQDRALRASQLEARLAQAQLQVLRMQLQPHFLFNALHSISALMHKDVARADSMIAALSDLLRMSLRSVSAQEVALEEEVAVLRGYLEIMNLRFGDRVRTEVDVDPATLAARVPTLCLQPLVENAFRHGFADHPGRGTVRVTVRRDEGGDVLRCVIDDDGRGLPGAGVREGVGLASTRARLRHLYGDRQRLDVLGKPGGGVRVVVVLPFLPATTYQNASPTHALTGD